LDPRFAGSNLGEDNGFLIAIKIHSMTSYGGEVKLSVPCCKILQHVKEHYRYKNRYFIGKTHGYFLPSSLALLSGVFWLLQESTGG
jgi:hypothetical protein